MFAGQPPPPSKAELQAQEAQANQEIKFTAGMCLLLYLSPFAIEYVRKLV
ncbi:uncharacterized protein BDZ99DRAFT_519120 [Mytilinidion resinicola]|uniref:Mitochondrial outer membrane translocase complex, subunit Tom5 n=1 Tax=Mytilinidion resinicola TaxID=574789 RepID=A0A6A6YTI0_9PEZI|nr:uncharacterized protein BDZ99DRAFT_519120 [Mytilinidion resinicola]KAF2811878.1 hypothetical protein BDZ99DRAFT_519120 [Mytilinidion resinicola]